MSSRTLRSFVNDGTLLPFDPSTEIPRHASILVTRFPPRESTFTLHEDVLGFYSGPTSIALLLWALRDVLPASIEGKSPVEWAKEYLEVSHVLLGQKPDGVRAHRIASGFCGLACERLCQAIVSAIFQNDESLLAPLFEHSTEIIEARGEDLDEWVVGRAGYLYHLRLARSQFPTLASKIDPIIPQVIDAMVVRSPTSADPWTYRGRYYFGAGHGWVGNVTQILLSEPTPARIQQARPWVLDIIRQQCDTGNWCTYADLHTGEAAKLMPNEEDRLQFGHGCPGVVSCLLCIRHLYEGDEEVLEKLDRAVDKAQACIWERGILYKESCLQHGAAGNSLGLVDMKRKETFLALSTQEKVDEANAGGQVEPSDSGSGLHRGLAGRIWAMAELQKGRSGVFLSFNEV